MAEQKESRQAWMQQLTTVLFLAVLGFFLIVLLIGMQTGVIGNFLAAIPKFIHGG
jgi:mannose/fructose/N-acetylgalactosamine-specific phosphotransferase system component IIC